MCIARKINTMHMAVYSAGKMHFRKFKNQYHSTEKVCVNEKNKEFERNKYEPHTDSNYSTCLAL